MEGAHEGGACKEGLKWRRGLSEEVTFKGKRG